jgi:Tfp pilus assembly protein PilF
MLLSLPAGGDLQFRADGVRLATQTAGHRAVVFRVAEGRELGTLVREPARRQENVCHSALHPAGRLLAVAMTDGVGLWDLDHDAAAASLPIGYTQSLLFEPSGDLVTTGQAGTLLWPVRASPGNADELRVGPPELLSALEGTGAIDQSRTGRLLGVPLGNGAAVLDLDRRRPPTHLGPQADVRSIALSPDGRWAATGSHNSQDGVKVWSLPGGRLEKQFPNPGLLAKALFSPDGRWLVTWMKSDGGCRFWAVDGWREGPPIEGYGLAFSPDGRLLAVGQNDGSTRLVEVETGRVVASLQDPHQYRPTGATFSPEGSRLILPGVDAPDVRVWDLRAVRRQLVTMGLDWDWPALPEPDPAAPPVNRLRVVTDLGGRDFSRGAVHPQEIGRLNAALEIDPGDTPALRRRAWIATRTGRDEEAISDYTRALAIRPRDPGILVARGEAYLRMGRYGPGFADYEASIAADPDRAAVRNELAWVYVTAPPPLRDPGKAVMHAQLAVRLSPEVASYRNTLGVALCRLGRHRESAIELETSLAAQPRDFAPFDLFFLAICHWRLGDSGRAKACFERALRLQADAHLPPGQAEELRTIRGEVEDVLRAPLGP